MSSGKMLLVDECPNPDQVCGPFVFSFMFPSNVSFGNSLKRGVNDIAFVDGILFVCQKKSPCGRSALLQQENNLQVRPSLACDTSSSHPKSYASFKMRMEFQVYDVPLAGYRKRRVCCTCILEVTIRHPNF